MSTLRRVVAAVALFSGVLAGTLPARAEPLASLLPNLFGPTGIILQTFFGHEAHFTIESQEQLTTLNDSLRGQISNFPLPSPASSATFRFDPTVGTFVRSTDSFGPIYAQRAETIGRGRFAFGLTYSRFTYDTVDGKDLEDGELTLTLRHEAIPCALPPPFCEFLGDVIRARIFADITSDIFVGSATFGVLDNLDLSLAVPVIHNRVELRGVATIIQSPTNPLAVHRFPDGSRRMEFRKSGEDTGFGDILLRGKYNFLRQPYLRLATGLDLQLPTGDVDELRGTDVFRTSPFLVASTQIWKIAPHANVGFRFSSDTDKLEHEFFYAAGFDWGIVQPLTLAFDVLGRHIIDNKRLRAGSATTISDSNLLDAAIGIKVNPWKNVLLILNALVPLNETGLRDRVTPTFGLEVSF